MTRGISSLTIPAFLNNPWLLDARVGDHIVTCEYCNSQITLVKGCYRLYQHGETARHVRNEIRARKGETDFETGRRGKDARVIHSDSESSASDSDDQDQEVDNLRSSESSPGEDSSTSEDTSGKDLEKDLEGLEEARSKEGNEDERYVKWKGLSSELKTAENAIKERSSSSESTEDPVLQDLAKEVKSLQDQLKELEDSDELKENVSAVRVLFPPLPKSDTTNTADVTNTASKDRKRPMPLRECNSVNNESMVQHPPPRKSKRLRL